MPEPVATDKVIGAEAVVTTALPEFSILTTGCALNTTPLLVVPGDVVNTRCRVPVMEKVPEVAVVSPVLVALRLKPEPAVPVISHPAKVAMPLEAVTGLVVQASVPVPEARDRETEADEEVTTLPPESSTSTTGWALNATPLVELPGEVVNTSWVAAPMASEKVGLEVAPRQPGAGGAQAVARAGRAGDRTPGEGGHAAGGVERVGGAGQARPTRG